MAAANHQLPDANSLLVFMHGCIALYAIGMFYIGNSTWIYTPNDGLERIATDSWKMCGWKSGGMRAGQ